MLLNSEQRVDFLSVDNFYARPELVRETALKLPFHRDTDFFHGARAFYGPDQEIKARFETLLGKTITEWNYPTNGTFQYCTPEDKIVYHMDSQQWAAIIFLKRRMLHLIVASAFFKLKHIWIVE